MSYIVLLNSFFERAPSPDLLLPSSHTLSFPVCSLGLLLLSILPLFNDMLPSSTTTSSSNNYFQFLFCNYPFFFNSSILYSCTLFYYCLIPCIYLLFRSIFYYSIFLQGPLESKDETEALPNKELRTVTLKLPNMSKDKALVGYLFAI